MIRIARLLALVGILVFASTLVYSWTSSPSIAELGILVGLGWASIFIGYIHRDGVAGGHFSSGESIYESTRKRWWKKMTQKEIEKKPWAHIESDEPYGYPSKYGETGVTCPDCGCRFPDKKAMNAGLITDKEQCPTCSVVIADSKKSLTSRLFRFNR